MALSSSQVEDRAARANKKGVAACAGVRNQQPTRCSFCSSPTLAPRQRWHCLLMRLSQVTA